jgi:hypothetical protein
MTALLRSVPRALSALLNGNLFEAEAILLAGIAAVLGVGRNRTEALR